MIKGRSVGELQTAGVGGVRWRYWEGVGGDIGREILKKKKKKKYCLSSAKKEKKSSDMTD